MKGKSRYTDPVYLDFEFNRIVAPKVNLVSCCVNVPDRREREKFWLHNSPNAQRSLAKFLRQYKLLIGFACVAESRSLLALDLNPLNWDWIDLFLEYRMLTNHNDKLQWGKQLVDGEVKTFKKPKPKFQRTEEDEGAGFKATHSLAEATYKLTGQIRDTDEKDKCRQLIISNPKSFRPEEQKRILNYNMEDVVFLPRIWEREKEEFRDLDDSYPMEDYVAEATVRGRYSAHTARMEARGYPINMQATRNFADSIPHIMAECQRDINSQFPDAKPFRWNRKTSNFSWNQKATREWITYNMRKDEIDRWMKTDGGALSLSLEAFERFFAYKHSYPRGNFGAQIVRFLKLRQSLYGFSDTGGKRKNFWDSVGPDGRVRPYMNIFGAQSSRSQPAASGFMFLKPAWMRSLVQPARGRFIAGIDYGQQEFFLAALESNDANMIEAYLSGDPYLHGAKLAGAIPWEGTKEQYKQIRDVYKNTYLGIQYGMTKYGLAAKLTGDTGRKWDEDEAQEQIDIFNETFPDYIEWKERILDEYEGRHTGMKGGIILPCGWRMFTDNDNPRSILNVPIQGFGASIMRKAVDNAEEKGVETIFTLHDAIYMEGSVGEELKIGILHDAMKDAFVHYFRDTEHEETAMKIKLDPFAWSPNYRESEIKIPTCLSGQIKCPVSNLYIDERAGDEYERFKKYFNKPDGDLL